MRVLVEKRLVAPSPAEVQAYFDAHRASFRTRPRFDLSVIRMHRDPGADLRASYARAEDLRDRIAAGKVAFEDAARAESDHPSATSGGRVGFMTARQLSAFPNVLATARTLRAGEVGKLVEQDGAFWIVRLESGDPEREMTFEEARGNAENKLGNERVRALQESIEAESIASLDLQM
ncbi:MAG: peptidylprolyl isomerase [Acidobacteriota bacterium]